MTLNYIFAKAQSGTAQLFYKVAVKFTFYFPTFMTDRMNTILIGCIFISKQSTPESESSCMSLPKIRFGIEFDCPVLGNLCLL